MVYMDETYIERVGGKVLKIVSTYEEIITSAAPTLNLKTSFIHHTCEYSYTYMIDSPTDFPKLYFHMI